MKVPYVDLARAYQRFAPEIDRCLLETARSGAYILGENVAAFEQAMATYLGVARAVAVGSGTDALHLAMVALSLEPGDEVITTPFTFAATVEAIERCSGHDGTYAVKKEYHDISKKIARPVVNRVKKAEADHFTSDCPMAAEQIAQGLDDHEGQNPMGLLRKAYGI